MTATVSGAHQQPPDLFELFPHETRFRLQPRPGQKQGDEILLPIHIQSAESVVLAGSCDLTKLNQQLAGEDLTATESMGVSMMLSVEKITESDVGAYNEVMLLANVVNNPPRGGTALPGVFAWQVLLTEDLPLRVGREYWGFPKSLAEISYEAGSDGVSFSVSAEGSVVFEGCCPAIATAPPAVQQVVTITPYSIRRSWQRVLSLSSAGMQLFSPSDSFRFDDRSELGQKLAAVDFTPKAWIYSKDIKFVGFADDRPRSVT